MELWSWGLMVFGLAGTFVVGQKTIWGWWVLLFNECLWIIYSLHTQQYGFIVGAIAYAAVYIKSYFGWKRQAAWPTSGTQPAAAARGR